MKNKLTFEKLESLFLQKYPNGQIWQTDITTNGYSLNVLFKAQSKIYKYNVANNLEAVKRLNLVDNNIMYKKDYDKCIKTIEELEININEGCWKDDSGFFGDNYIIKYSETELQQKRSELEYFKKITQNAIIV